jgi:hypothetical protein
MTIIKNLQHFCLFAGYQNTFKIMSIFLDKVLAPVFVIAGILALVTVLVNINLQQVNCSLYSLVADIKCSGLI